MATNVSMQTPIPDYGNFGQVVSENWQAANERALKLKMQDDRLDQQAREHDDRMAYNEGLAIGQLDGIDTLDGRKMHMLEKEYAYNAAQRKEMNRTAEHKLNIAKEKDTLRSDYMKYEEGGGAKWWQEALDYFTPELFGYDAYDAVDTQEEWMEQEGRSAPDYKEYDPGMVTPETAEYLRTQKSWEAGTTGSDAELINNSLMNLLNAGSYQGGFMQSPQGGR